MGGRTLTCFGVGTIVLAAVALTACRSDGREMRPAEPDQTASVSTVAPPTDPPPVAGEADPLSGGIDLPVLTTTTLSTPTSLAVSAVAPELRAPWVDGGEIDPKYSCDGENVSPEIEWSAAPDGTVEVAVAMTDDDAPGFVHWAVAALDPLSTSLGEDRVPPLALEAQSSNGTPGWFGPCPPPGETHTYRLTVYFLGQQTELEDGASGVEMLAAIKSHAFDSASVSGVYTRP